jgi:two-component system phosphate regulon response regulator PhoB
MGTLGTILIVDDEEDLRNLLHLAASREGFDTVLASTGAEALQRLTTLRPSLVVLDLMLPDLSGTEVCRRIRANPDLAGTPVIMLTARGEEIDRVVGFEVGADDYVVKSQFSVREFLLRVRAVLRRTTVESEVTGPVDLDEPGAWTALAPDGGNRGAADRPRGAPGLRRR